MLLNPQQIVDKKIVTGPVSVQPNAIDFAVDGINVIESTLAYISNDKSLVNHSTQLKVELTDVVSLKRRFGVLHEGREIEEGQVFGWLLEPNREYDVTSSAYVEVPEGAAAFLIPRSTFTRNGASLISGLYDSGFKGNIGFVLHTASTPLFIEQGTFIGQIYFTDSQNVGEYKGGYNTKDGQHWADAVATKEIKQDPKIAIKAEAEPAKPATKAEAKKAEK